ncbi:DUF427 domain-containing protein [Crenothrix sp.]|uniref:DUF427 domain-containing protein n=1 Tax=Crenothrix sp. TaxID=3100433 RepID=UPI00374DAED8
MNKSPGHQKWPDHEVQEQHINQHVQANINGEILAASNDVIKVNEDQHPPRYYFPRSNVQMGKLERSPTTTVCVFKGTAHYYHLKLSDQVVEDAAWTYEHPYDEHLDLKDRIAFYSDKIRGFHIGQETKT